MKHSFRVAFILTVIACEFLSCCCGLHFTPDSAKVTPSGSPRPVLPSDYPYPCPTPPPAGERVAGPFDWHHEYQNEWYYVSGSLIAATMSPNGQTVQTTELAPMGYQISTTFYNISATQITTENNIAVSSQDHFTVEGVGPAIFGDFNLTFTNGGMSTSYLILKGNPGDVGSVYSIQASNVNMTIDLTLTALAPLMYQGDGGYYGYTAASNSSCTAYYYVTIPRLFTTGTIQLNNVTHQVTGYSWFDHEWGGIFPGWIWLGINVGKSSIMITVPRINGTNRYDYSIMDVQDMDGKMSQGKIVGIDVLANWTSPITGIIYPTEIRFHSNHNDFPSFSTKPFFDNQEAGPLLHFWEGDVKVLMETGPFEGDQGVGYLELMGFTAPSTVDQQEKKEFEAIA